MRRLKIAVRELLFGPVYKLDGHRFRIPRSTPYVAKRAIDKGYYEAPERNLIRKFLPKDLPVIELGGSFGIVSRTIRGKISASTPLVVVEANPALLEFCEENAIRGTDGGHFQLVNAAVGYSDTGSLKFTVSDGIHDSHVATTSTGGGRTIEVQALTLKQLLAETGIAGDYSLVCDIEGMEYDLFERDARALAQCQCAIVEYHPGAFEKSGKSLDGFLKQFNKLGFETVGRELNVIAGIRKK